MREHPAWQRSPLYNVRASIAWSTNPAPIRQPSFAILDALQFAPPAVQMDALFTTAVAMAEVIGLDSHEMVARAKRMLPDVDGPFTDQLAAVTDYAKGELRR